MGLKTYFERKREKKKEKLQQEETLKRYNQLTQEEINKILDTRKQAYMEIAISHVKIIGQKEAMIDFPIPEDETEYEDEEE